MMWLLWVAALHRKTGLRADEPASGQSQWELAGETELFSGQLRQQLEKVFSKMEHTLLLKLFLDSRPISKELEEFTTVLVSLSQKLTMQVVDRQAEETFAPCVEVCMEDGTPTGIGFHGVPGGHEFTSFILGLYNAAGPGQAMDEDAKRKIAAIDKTTDIKLLITLSCTMCPDLVVAVQRIAAGNAKVTAHIYDVLHFEDLRKRYKVMSVPCMVINDRDVYLGRKTLAQVLELIP